MNNFQALKDYLTEQNLRYEDGWLDDGTAYCRILHRFKSGQDVTLLFVFNPNETMLDIYLIGLVKFDNPLKREEVLILLNGLNIKYRFYKFILNDDGTVNVRAALPTLNFCPEEAVGLGVSMVVDVENEYQKFMRLRWA